MLNCDEPDLFWLSEDTEKGFWKDGNGSVERIPSKFFLGEKEYNYVNVDISETLFAAPGSNIESNIAPGSSSFCCLTISAGTDVFKTGDAFAYSLLLAVNLADWDDYIYYAGTYFPYILGRKGVAYEGVSGDIQSRVPYLVANLWGYDAATERLWVVTSTGVNYSAAMVGYPTLAALEGFRLYANILSSLSMLGMSVWQGSKADKILGNAADLPAAMAIMNGNKTGLSVSSSPVLNADGIYDRGDIVNWSPDGINIYPAIVNRMLESLSMRDWTLARLALSSLRKNDSAGVKTLTKLDETAVYGTHTATETFSPTVTGKHWLSCTLDMGNIDALHVKASRSADVVAHSIDNSGAVTTYASSADAVLEHISGSLYRLHMPLTLTAVGTVTVLLQALRKSGSSWLTTYTGITTNRFYSGQWSFIRSDKCPRVFPVSVGAVSTAIASVIDWNDAEVINRNKNNRFTCEMVIEVDEWAASDMCLWSWRQDDTNGIDVFLKYDSTVSGTKYYALELLVRNAGAAVAVPLSTGLLGLESATLLVESIRVSMIVDESGNASWWLRSESDNPIMGVTAELSGDDTITAYNAVTPTSIRIGSDCEGMYQQQSRVIEAKTW